MNKIFLTGNLTKEPEGSTTQSGLTVCKFTLAVARRFSGKDGENRADFFRITAWRGLAENCNKYLYKGAKAAVTGSIELNEYTDKEGNKRLSVDVTAEEVEFLSRKDATEASPPVPPKGTQMRVDSLEPVNDDDLPF